MTDSSPSRRPGPSTLGIHAGEARKQAGDPVVPPVVQSATFFWAGPDDGELKYSRYGNNPNQVGLALKMAALEGTEAAVPLASGMGAMSMALLALAQAGDHIVASSRLYGATQVLLREELPKRGIETTFVDPFAGDWGGAVRAETKVILIEIPTNPTLRIVDPRPLAALAERCGARLVCDATFASPVNFRAASAGVDVVVQSATKYLGGHSDIIAGVVAGPAGVIDDVTHTAHLYGPALDPHAAWLLDRGLRTLDVRIRRHNENALALAAWLERRPEVKQVIYPGLESHPDHHLATELMDGFGGMLSLVLEGGGDAADAFMGGLRLALAAPSLGGVETLVSQPRFTSHRGMSQEALDEQGIPEGFVRVSVGVEDADDLRDDFRQALESLA